MRKCNFFEIHKISKQGFCQFFFMLRNFYQRAACLLHWHGILSCNIPVIVFQMSLSLRQITSCQCLLQTYRVHFSQFLEN